MNDRHATRNDRDILCGLREALAGDAYGIIAEGHCVELKFTIDVGGNALGPVRRFCPEHDHGILNRTVLRVVYDSADRTVDVGERGGSGQQQDGRYEQLEAWHLSLYSLTADCLTAADLL